MTQEHPPSKLGADIVPSSPSETALVIVRMPDGPSSPQYFLPEGPHGPVRAALSWANRLLASDENGYVSVISVRDLRRALLTFQREVRAQALEDPALRDFSAGDTRSRSGAPPPRIPGTNRKRGNRSKYRNFKD